MDNLDDIADRSASLSADQLPLTVIDPKPHELALIESGDYVLFYDVRSHKLALGHVRRNVLISDTILLYVYEPVSWVVKRMKQKPTFKEPRMMSAPVEVSKKYVFVRLQESHVREGPAHSTTTLPSFHLTYRAKQMYGKFTDDLIDLVHE